MAKINRTEQIAKYGQDAAFVANVISTQHSAPARKLRNVLYLLESGRSVRTAQFSIDTLLVDGIRVPFSALDKLETLLDIFNPKDRTPRFGLSAWDGDPADLVDDTNGL
jgi:hypothetical protein